MRRHLSLQWSTARVTAVRYWTHIWSISGPTTGFDW